MKSSAEIFEISSDNLTNLIIDYYSSINTPGSLLDSLDQYKKYCVSDKKVLSENPNIEEMISRDKYGEEIGISFRNELDYIKAGYCQERNNCLFFDKDNRLVAFWRYTNPDKLNILYDVEVFEYNDDIRYSRKAGCITCGEENYGFSYYRYQNGKIAEILNVIGNFGGYGNDDLFALELPKGLKVNHLVFDETKEYELIRKDFYELSYSKVTGRYMIADYFDGLNPPPKKEPIKRVIDTQKRLCNTLSKKITEDINLAKAVEIFFEVISNAKPNEEEMLLYEVGFNRKECGNICFVSLVRQTPTKNDEFYQLHLELDYEVSDINSSLKECQWHEAGDEDLKEYILDSNAYREFVDKKAHAVNVWVDET